MKRIIPVLFCSIYFYFSQSTATCQSKAGDAVTIQIDGSKKFQQIDGIGVNANTRSWEGEELKPALHLLLDSLRFPLWRVIVETVEKWEDENDNQDPFSFNWDYYNKLYETPKFQKAWEMIGFLNSRGVSDNLMISFMGPVPEWMGKKTIKPGYDDEYVEMITSFFYYAKNIKHLKFGLISPTNESDWRNEGPEIDEFHYASVFRKLIDRMAALGMGDVRYVGPDPAGMENGIKRYIPELMKDPVIMSKLSHIGLHSYSGYYANIDSAIKRSPYPDVNFWITEWNAWRNGLDDGKIGVYDYTFASQCVYHLLDLLKNGAAGAFVWEGYDSYYEHHAPSIFSYWGIVGYDPGSRTYEPRKHFYCIQQVSKFVMPGSWRIGVSSPADSLGTVAFYDSSSHSVNIIGINRKDFPVALKGSLIGLPSVGKLEMYYTDSVRNMYKAKNVRVSGKIFKVTIPANCIFTLTGKK